MKKNILCLYLFVFVSFFCFSEINISFTPSLKTTLGKYGEYVYSYSGKSIISYLEWENMPLFKLGADAKISYKNLILGGSFFYGLPLECGKMYDSDWDNYGVKTTYSISKNNALKNYDFSFSLSYIIDCKYFYLIPEFSYLYYYDFFQTSNGEGWYGRDIYSKTGKTVSWDSPDARHYRKLSRIELQRTSKFYFIGLNGQINLGKYFELTLGTFLSPYAYVYNSDLHRDDNGTNRDFYLNSTQEMNFSRFLEEVSVKCKLSQYISIPISFSCIFGDIEKGILEEHEQYAGTDLVHFNIKVGCQINLVQTSIF